MPELKHSFQAGRMNKDSDERLVPNGEYREAMNIQVRTTDGGTDDLGDAGTVQNIKGNSLIEPTAHLQSGFTSSVIGGPNTNFVMGSVADEKTNSIYFLIAGANLRQVINLPTQISSKKLFIDTILEVKETSSGAQSSPVVVDKYAIVDACSNVFGTTPPNGVNSYRDKKKSFLVITHYQRLLDYIRPDFVHVLSDGKIVKSGCMELAEELEKKGYNKIK